MQQSVDGGTTDDGSETGATFAVVRQRIIDETLGGCILKRMSFGDYKVGDQENNMVAIKCGTMVSRSRRACGCRRSRIAKLNK
jgi:hypothetical protein